MRVLLLFDPTHHQLPQPPPPKKQIKGQTRLPLPPLEAITGAGKGGGGGGAGGRSRWVLSVWCCVLIDPHPHSATQHDVRPPTIQHIHACIHTKTQPKLKHASPKNPHTMTLTQAAATKPKPNHASVVLKPPLSITHHKAAAPGGGGGDVDEADPPRAEARPGVAAQAGMA